MSHVMDNYVMTCHVLQHNGLVTLIYALCL